MSLATPTHAIFDDWHEICGSDEIITGTGMPARVLGRQLAIFSTSEGYFALGNCDPFSGANVLARGIIGDIGGKLVVASPVYKQHFCLRTGICLEDMSVTVPVWRVNVRDGRVFVTEGER